jgi:threonine 3-dehydrogenase
MGNVRVLVTGGAGFLGRHLVQTLLTEMDVLSVDRTHDLAPPGLCPGRLHAAACDLLDAAELARLCRAHPLEVIYHLAGTLALPAERNPAMACRVNIEGTANLLEAARLAGARQVVFASSIAVYGAGAEGPITESAPLRPELVYGVTKVAGELLGSRYVGTCGLDFRALRLPSVIGPGRGGESVTGNYSRLVEAARRGEPFEVHLPPETCLPLVYVKDAVAALRALAAAPRARLRQPAYHVTGFAPPLSLGALADAVSRHRPGAVVTFRPDPAAAERVHGLARLRLDDGAARADWDWAPRFDADTMVADFLAGG